MLELHPGAVLLHVAEHHGEPWRDRVTLELVTPRLVGQRLPVCIAGARAAPPDDCESPSQFQAMLAAIAYPLDPASADLCAWLPDGFDLAYVDLAALNAGLSKIPRHRPA